VPLGTVVHNIELKLGKGGQIVRSAGNGAQVVAKEGDYVTLRLPSTEVRMVRRECFATIGQIGNVDHELQAIGQGGREPLARSSSEGARRGHEPGRPPAGRWRGQDVGRSSAGLAVGQAEGVKTRKKKKQSNKLIVRGRKRGKATT
jgi:large subunit ribosomal protein L2